MKTKNLMVSILVGVLVVALWYTMLFKSVRAKTSKVKADTVTQESRLSPLQSQLARAQNDAAHVDTFNAQLKSLQDAVPNSPALAAFIRDANGIAEASGVAWQSVTHGPPTASGTGSMSITLGIQVKGTYAQVLDYLGRLAALQRLVVVDSVQMTPAASATTGGGGAGTGSDSSGGSTGPFTGGTQLATTITARMFESPAAALAAGSDSTVAASTSGGTQSPSGAPTAGLNNS